LGQFARLTHSPQVGSEELEQEGSVHGVSPLYGAACSGFLDYAVERVNEEYAVERMAYCGAYNGYAVQRIE
jgi:hypothetical protein